MKTVGLMRRRVSTKANERPIWRNRLTNESLAPLQHQRLDICRMFYAARACCGQLCAQRMGTLETSDAFNQAFLLLARLQGRQQGTKRFRADATGMSAGVSRPCSITHLVVQRFDVDAMICVETAT